MPFTSYQHSSVPPHMGLTCTLWLSETLRSCTFPFIPRVCVQGLLVLFNEGVISETYSSNGGLLAISSRGVCDICSQEDNWLLKHCWPEKSEWRRCKLHLLIKAVRGFLLGSCIIITSSDGSICSMKSSRTLWASNTEIITCMWF